MIRRYSSRTGPLRSSFLDQRLREAHRYDRIAGYFSSSLLALAGEAIDTMHGPIRIVCTSELDVRDVQTARAAHQAMRQEWCAHHPERFVHDHRERFRRLYDLLRRNQLTVRVLPTDTFGLMHGKAEIGRAHV